MATLKKKARVVSSSLLANISVNKNVPKRFKLGMCDWTDFDSKKENDVTCDCFGPFELPTCGLLQREGGTNTVLKCLASVVCVKPSLKFHISVVTQP